MSDEQPWKQRLAEKLRGEIESGTERLVVLPPPENYDVFDWIRLIGVRTKGERPPWLKEMVEGTLDPARCNIISEEPDNFVVEVDGKAWRIEI